MKTFWIFMILLALFAGCSSIDKTLIDCEYALKICQEDTTGDSLKDSDCIYGEPCLAWEG